MRPIACHAAIPAAVLSLVAVGLSLPQASAQTKPAAAVDVQLTPEEQREKDLRKACKVDLCSAFHVRKPADGHVSCGVLKTWRKEQLTKMVAKGGISWPWGNAKCTADLKFKRAELIKAMTDDAYDLQLDKHDIKCELDRETDKYEIKMEISPKVQFSRGKAVKAQLNWGKIDAPVLAKSVLWSATAADNAFGALQSTVVDDINDFIGAKCLEVKDEWKGQ